MILLHKNIPTSSTFKREYLQLLPKDYAQFSEFNYHFYCFLIKLLPNINDKNKIFTILFRPQQK